MSSTRRSLSVLLGLLAAFTTAANAQTYLSEPGKPTFATIEPVEHAYINMANGNLHLQIGFGSYPQAGQLRPASIGAVYDSNLAWFENCTSSGCSWTPNNPNLSAYYGGWRFSGTGVPIVLPFFCQAGTCGWYTFGFDGTKHYFFFSPSAFTCNNNDTATTSSAYASDSSGYLLISACYPGSNGSSEQFEVAVYAPDGTSVGAFWVPSEWFVQPAGTSLVDTSGNSISAPVTNENTISQQDSLSRTLYSSYLCGGSYSCFNVPNSQTTTSSTSPTSPYSFTGETAIPVKTNFGQSGVSECNTSNGCSPFVVFTGIALPDGTSYSFKYDCDSSTGNAACGSPAGQSAYYGTLISVTLPTGATIQYGYITFADAYNNKWRWVNSRTSGGATWTYQPVVALPGFCSSFQLDCQQTVTITNPDGSSKKYTYTINNGAWPATEQFYDTNGTLLSTITNTFDFTNPCSSLYSGCVGAAYIRLTATQTSIPSSNGTITNQTKYSYDSAQTGNVTAVQQWGFQLGASPSFNAVPDRAVYTPYPGPTAGTVAQHLGISGYTIQNINRPQSATICNNSSSDPACPGGGTRVSQTLYSYDVYGGNCPSGGPASGFVGGNLTSAQSLVSGSTYVTTNTCYFAGGEVSAVTDPNGNTTQFGYGSTAYADASPPSNPPSSVTAGSAYPTTITLPIIGAESAGYYFGTGQVALTTDQNAQTTYFHYLDGFSRLTHTYLPDGGWSLLNYAPGGTQVDSYTGITATAPTTSCPSSGSSCMHTTQLADSLGRPYESILASDPDGPTYTTTSYDSSSRPQTASNPYRSTSDSTYGFSTVTYDGLSRPVVLSEPDGSSVHAYYGANVTSAGGLSAQLCAPATYGYGYPKVAVDEAGNKTQIWADAFGRTIEVDEPNPPSTSPSVQTCYTYDVLNNLTGVYQTGGTSNQTQWRVRTYTYDLLSRLLSKTEPETGTTTYTYDNNSNVLTRTAPAPNQTGTATVTTTYQYDALNRLTQKSYSDGITPTVTYVYDAATTAACTLPTLTISNGLGTRTGMCDGPGSEAWSYDPIGRIKADARTTNSLSALGRSLPINLSTAYTYNFDGTLATLTYPSGRLIAYTPGAAGRTLSAVDTSNNISFASNAHYAPTGDLASVQNGTAIVSAHIFNSRLQPCWAYATSSTPLPWNTTACTATTTPGNVFDLKYSLNLGSSDNGNIIGLTNNRDNTRSQNFTYDPLNRLASAQTQTTGVTIPNPNCWGLTFAYDPWANLLQSSATGPSGCGEPLPLNVSVTAANQMVGYSYDAAGNLLNDGANPYSYNPENQLTSIGTSSPITGYSYDGDGRRLLKIATSIVCICPGGGGCRPGCSRSRHTSVEKIYWYGLGAQPLSETDYAGNLVDEYVSFNGARTARIDSSKNVAYYFADHLGSSRVVTDASGNILDDSDFYPFGVERPVSSSSGNTYKFTGYERDVESGLDYASARHFSSALGRFMSPDPLSGYAGNPQSWNRYAYVQNNPLNSVDPSGMCDENDTSDCDDSGDSPNSGTNDSAYQAPLFQGVLGIGYSFTGGETGVWWDYGGYLLPNGDWYLEGGNPQESWWSPFGYRWHMDGNIFHTPTMAERGMGPWAAALPLAARQAEPGVNFAATVLQLFGAVALGAGTGGEAPATETFYRTMSTADYAQLLKTGQIPATGETFISPSLQYARQYSGVTVQFNMRAGTNNALLEMGVRNTALNGPYESLPLVQRGWGANSAFFKLERNVVNVGLGKGSALDLFNKNIVSFGPVPEP